MNKKIKSPVRKGVCKVPVIVQLEAVECGAACLTMIASYYGKWLPLEQVRKDCGVSRDGAKAENVMKAAESYGFSAEAFRFPGVNLLREDCEFPCIAFWNLNHFVVIDGFSGNKAVINDPAKGRIKLSIEEFSKSFTGVCILLTPSEDFKPEGKPKSVLSFVNRMLKGTAAAIIFTALASAALSVFEALNPMMSKIFMDRILPEAGTGWSFSYEFFVLLAFLGILHLTAMFVNVSASLRINAKMSVVGNASYMWKILRLPMEFYSQRLAGDIHMRKASMSSVASTLINTLAPLLINVLMTIFYIAVMMKYSVILSAIGLLSVVLNSLLAYLISKQVVDVVKVHTSDTGKFYSSTVSGIKMIESIKANGAEDGFFRRWAGYQALANTSMQRLVKISAKAEMLPEFIISAINLTVIAAGVFLTMRGEFTLGMIMTFQGLMTAFMMPVRTIIAAGRTIQEMRTDMERIDDVMEYPDDENCKERENPEGIETEYSKLSGQVELKNVTFGYSRLEPPLIRDFSISVKPGGSIAFVGATGCGKSTVSKLISGLYTQWDGEILFDGKKISDIDRNVFTGSVAVVDQDITVFEDTIAANIKMWDKSIEDFEMILAARDAQIHHDIMEREGGYSYRLTDGGRDLSGGQRQRLEIARVLAQDPTIVILDEATSALDSKTEFEVVRAIKNRGITAIIIAHRLSTIRDCDEIIVISNGVIAERGKHDELMAMNGLYAGLVTSE